MSIAVAPSENLVAYILTETTSDRQFERFCVQHYSITDKTTYVPTSYNYDNSRDARTEFTVRAGGTSYICSSVEGVKEPDSRRLARLITKKATGDYIGLLTKDAKPRRVRFCFAAKLTEPLIDSILEKLREINREPELEVTGQFQIVPSIGLTPTAFETIFATNVDTLDRYLNYRRRKSDVVVGMRAALSTVLSRDAHAVRTSIVTGMALHALSLVVSADAAELASSVSSQLGLLTPVQESYISDALSHMRKEDWVRDRFQRIEMTRKGREELERRQRIAAQTAVTAISAFRSIADASTSRVLTEPEFGRVWRCVEDGLADMFLAHGLQLTREIAAFASGRPMQTQSGDIERGLDQIAKRIEALPIRRELASEIAAVIPDLIRDPSSPSFDLVCHLCTLYVASCSLSLDPALHSILRRRVQNWTLFLDTQFLLSFLGTGESDHLGVREIISGWRSTGGTLLVAESVADEAGRHALAANEKYWDWRRSSRRPRRQAGRPGRDALVPPDDNVFLRSFIAESGGNYGPSNWRAYISNFTTGNDDGRTVRRNITIDHGLELAMEDGICERTKDELQAEILRFRKTEYGEFRSDHEEYTARSECDARILSLLLKYRRSSEYADRFVAIISKSKALIRVSESRRADFGLESPVIPISRLSFALALVPEASVNLRTLRTVLFDSAFGSHVASEYVQARRMFRKQGIRSQYDLAGQAALERIIDSKLRET